MSEEVRVFCQPEFARTFAGKQLLRAFKHYKQFGIQVFDTFKLGKDAPFNRPASAVLAELQHVHMLPVKSKGNTSDRFLVYSRGFQNPNYYIVLALLEPDAHSQSRNTLVMSKLAEKAEEFRQKF